MIRSEKSMTDREFFEQLGQKAEEGLRLWDSASVSLGVVKDGQVLFAGGFGLRDTEKGLPADGRTLYQIGSCSKAFTAAVCAALVEKGLLAWDTPIRAYVPDVRLYDDFTSESCTLRDLLSHRTGLPRHEYSWYGEQFTRKELVEHMRYFEPSQPIRAAFQYCNYGYVLAGHIAETVSGKTWERLVQEYIFDPLGMSRTNCYIDGIEQDENHAVPYQHDPTGDGLHGIQQIPFYRTEVENREQGVGAPFGPAGSINSCVEDMLKWVQLFLNEGKCGDQQVIGWKALGEAVRPQMLLKAPLDMPQPETEMWCYGLGWFVEKYRGVKMVQHGGNINGFSGFTCFLPEKKLGIVAYTNCDSSFFHYALGRTVADHFLGAGDGNWIQRYYDFVKERHAKLPELIRHFTGEQVMDTVPSHPLAAYAGLYRRLGYGDMRIALGEDGSLTMRFIGAENALKHFHYDTFVTSGILGELPPGMPAHFHTAEVGGGIDAVSMPLVTEEGGALVVFRRVEEKQG